ncbi:hypothetical protein BDN72DRAFT_963324 [Pluteus cervinus]|uniref:Uncharacterized protein n=1 Tax=Pluteus cervinus TaxID=181527 RepID=A0ACD3AEF1_9AGAR|nr:hypothetical protein BDN72DRAFT_963324 [Pluteus cervinus]
MQPCGVLIDGKTPDLPYELEEGIFKYLARTDRRSIPSLMRVARRVKGWVEPFLYSIIIRRWGHKAYNPPVNCLPKYAHHVRHLLVYYTQALTLDELIQHLTLCTNLVDVALWCAHDKEAISHALPTLPLQRFSGFIPHLKPENRQEDVSKFTGITHLELLDNGLTWPKLAWLKDLRNLTHLALVDRLDPEIVVDIFQNCGGLQELVLTHSYGIQHQEQRIIFNKLDSVQSYAEEWLIQADAECITFWERAEM